LKNLINHLLFLILLNFLLTQSIYAKTTRSNDENIKSKISTTHIPFIANVGQLDKNVKFCAFTFGGMVFVTNNGEIVYSLPKTEPTPVSNWGIMEKTMKGLVLKEEFLGGKIDKITGQGLVATKVNYFKGKNPADWKHNIPTFDAVILDEVYKGVDIKLKAYGNNVEKLFFIKPGAKPQDVKIKLNGAKTLIINEAGEIEIETKHGIVAFSKPVAFQENDGKKEYISVEYKVKGNEYGFIVGNYNSEKTLIIDPLLASTFLGGSSTDDDYEPSIALDHNGNVYLSGYTYSTDFPTTPGVYNENYNGGNKDRFVSKFDGDLSTLIASTFIGGSSEELGMGMGIDNNGNVYLAGYTSSNNFPTSPGSYDEIHNGGRDVYISKFSSDLTTLLASTFLGGSGNEGQTWPRIDLTIAESGNVYLAGLTRSGNFPTTSGAYRGYFFGGTNGGDPFVAKFNSDLTTLLASTYLGGSRDEWRVSIIVNENENVYVCGETESSNYPTTTGAYDPSFNGWSDIFVTKLTTDLTTLSASTLIGKSQAEEALTMRLNENGDVYIAGYTKSSNFPTTQGAYDQSWNGGDRDAYITKFDSNLTTLLASTFIGGNGRDDCRDLIIDGNGHIYITGNTASSNFPTTTGAYDEIYNGGSPHGDVFISRLNSDLTTLPASSFIGGTFDDVAFCLTLANNGNIYVGGYTASSNFPTTTGSYDNSHNGGSNDCFIVKFDSILSANPTSVKDIEQHPTKFNLYNNYPNPFNSQTAIRFNLPHSSQVSIKIYDIQGKLIRSLLTGQIWGTGSHIISWNGVDDYGKTVSSGEYFYKLEAGGLSEIKKMLFLK